MTNTKAGAPPATLSSYAYALNPNGNRTQVTDTTGGVATYGYDDLDRLTSVEYPEGDCQDYTYDAVGNRLTLTTTPKVSLPCDGTPSTVTTTYNQVDEIKTMTGVTGAIPFDTNGNLLSLGTPVGTPSSQTFLYDQQDRLFRTGPCRGDFNNDGAVNPGDQALLAGRVGTSEGSTNYDLLFDVDGNRSLNPGDQALVAAEISSGRNCKNTGTNTGNERNWYNGDGLRVRAKTFPNGASPVTDDYVWDVGAGLPQVLQDSRTQGGTTTTTTHLYGLGLIATTDSAGTASYYLADGLGSTTQLVDAGGRVTDTYTYDVFGALRSSSGSTSNPFDFAGQQTDHTANRGLQYLRARHYDPSLGRFLQRDPVPFAQRYGYAGSDPVNRIDPSGLCVVCDFIDDKGADLKDWGTDVIDHPGSIVQITTGTAVALTSTGDRSRDGGVTLYEKCRGACSLSFAGGSAAITLGHDIFVEDNANEALRRHELTHVSQGDRYGLLWFPAYFTEQLRVSPRCRFDFSCYEHSNRFEVEALKAEESRGGKE